MGGRKQGRTSPPRHDRGEHVLPAVGAVDMAGTKLTAFEITELVEQEQRVVAGAGEVAVVRGAFLLAVGRADA